MKRRRFFETLTAALLAVLIGAVLAAPVMAQGNSGKNKGKDEDGGTTNPPPLTFMVYWLPAAEEFGASQFNNQADAIGSYYTTAADGSMRFMPALFLNGVVYDINSIVHEPVWDIYLVRCCGSELVG